MLYFSEVPTPFFPAFCRARLIPFVPVFHCSYYKAIPYTNNKLAMSRFILPVFLCSLAQSLVIIPQGMGDALTEISPNTPAQCAHNEDTEFAVIAWPSDSW